jgi:hypothetical protein
MEYETKINIFTWAVTAMTMQSRQKFNLIPPPTSNPRRPGWIIATAFKVDFDPVFGIFALRCLRVGELELAGG